MKDQGSKRIFRWVINNIVWIILIVIIVMFSITIPGFVSIGNYINIVYHSVFIGILAIAVSYCLISNNLDLSVELMAGFGAIVSAWLCGSSVFASGYAINPYLGLLIVLGIGAVLGMINAFFVLKLNINSFLVTLSTYIIVRGVAVLLTGGQGVSRLPNSFRLIDTIRLLDIPLMVYLMFVFYLVFQFILRNTRFGRHIYIIGGNSTAAYNFGVNVKGTILRGLHPERHAGRLYRMVDRRPYQWRHPDLGQWFLVRDAGSSDHRRSQHDRRRRLTDRCDRRGDLDELHPQRHQYPGDLSFRNRGGARIAGVDRHRARLA